MSIVLICWMKVVDAIKKRKSIRKFQKKKISKKIILELIKAARLAPSGCNIQNHAYHIITDPKLILFLKKEKIYFQEFVYTAPLLIVCCCNPTRHLGAPKSVENEGIDIERYKAGISPDLRPHLKLLKSKGDENLRLERAMINTSIASSYIVLRATELGLGTCYIGLMFKNKIKKILNIPEDYNVLFTIAVGYPAKEGNPRVRKSLKNFFL